MHAVYKDKICIVTGAASGIGKAVSQALLELGARVVAADLNEDAMQAWSAQYNQESIRINSLNVTDYDGFKALIDKTVADFGRLDYLFNIAGISIAGEAKDLTIDHWRKVLAVDLDGVVNGSTVAYKQMAKQGHGHIVNLSSIQGLVPLPLEAPYVAAKFGVTGLSQALRVEGAELGVKVSVVCPGFVKTAIFADTPMVGIDREKHRESMEAYEKSGISAEGCAQVILKGTAKNRAIIPVTTPAKLMWWLSRLSPKLLFNALIKDLAKTRQHLK